MDGEGAAGKATEFKSEASHAAPAVVVGAGLDINSEVAKDLRYETALLIPEEKGMTEDDVDFDRPMLEQGPSVHTSTRPSAHPTALTTLPAPRTPRCLALDAAADCPTDPPTRRPADRHEGTDRLTNRLTAVPTPPTMQGWTR